MQDIRLVGNDGEYLNLETQEGDKFRLILDDSLRSAIKRDPTVRLDAVTISPREIQDAIRAGVKAEEVASKYSVAQDYVDKFAQTVVDEIGHIIASAQAVRIAIAADRFSDATQHSFGEVVAERIFSSGGSAVVWNASKHEGLPWHVVVTFETEAGPEKAIWAFDQRKLILSPENEPAIKISAAEHSSLVPTPKLRPIDVDFETEPEGVTQVIDIPKSEPVLKPVPSAPEPRGSERLVPEPTDSEPTGPELTVLEPSASKSSMPANVESISAVSTAEHSKLSAIEELTRASVESAVVQDMPLSATADLLEALRKKRAASSVSGVSKAPTSAGNVGSESHTPAAASEVDSKPEAGSIQVSPEIAPEPVVAKKGRPSMPSWDEIVFGTKADD
jgi:hypothetical protein